MEIVVCTCPSKTKIENKVKEFDAAINLLSKKISEQFPTIPKNIANNITLANLGYINSWDIAQG